MNPKKKKKQKPLRNRQIAAIKILSTQAGLIQLNDDSEYRTMLRNVTGKTSCKDLTERQLGMVIGHLKHGYNGAPSAGKPKFMDEKSEDPRVPYLQKIEQYLKGADRSWNYAHGIARKMFGVERMDWLKTWQVEKVMLALLYDARRHGREV